MTTQTPSSKATKEELVNFPIEKLRQRKDRDAFNVHSWIKKNSYSWKDFTDIEMLVSLKEKQNSTISLVLPTLNEEATIGNIIKEIKKHLIEEHSLIDELIVIDSKSTDNTRKIVRELDVPLFIHQSLMPEFGTYDGTLSNTSLKLRKPVSEWIEPIFPCFSAHWLRAWEL